jgi:transcriptional regulator with XRE-family HTH domain
MTISQRIFDLLAEKRMSQREFSEKTGIAQSTISDWKRKKTNPVSEKILIICQVLGVTPNELLSGTEGEGTRSNQADYMIVARDSELGDFLAEYQKMDARLRERLLGYMKALQEMK